MQVVDLQTIGDEMAIKWSDGSESYIRMDVLRRGCPCAGCKGEVDVMGHLHRGPQRPLSEASFRLREVRRVGSYALEPIWGDGHNAGLFTFDYLKQLAALPQEGSCCGEQAHSHPHPPASHRHDHSPGGHHHGHGGCGCRGH